MSRSFLLSLLLIGQVSLVFSQQPLAIPGTDLNTAFPEMHAQPPRAILPPLSDTKAETPPASPQIISVTNTRELFRYLLVTCAARDFRSAALGLAFDKAGIDTPAGQDEYLARWIQIIERLDDRFPRNFPSDTVEMEHRFFTADSHVDLLFTKDVIGGYWQIAAASVTQTEAIYRKVRDDPPIRRPDVSPPAAASPKTDQALEAASKTEPSIDSTAKTDTGTAPAVSAPKPESTPAIPLPAAPQLSDSEAEDLHVQLAKLDSLKTPGELLHFIRNRYLERNYRAAALGMAFSQTKYSTLTQQQQCLSNWSHIIERLDDRYPMEFPADALEMEHRFSTAESYVDLVFLQDKTTGCWQLGPGSILQTDSIYQKVRDDPPIRRNWFLQNVPAWMFQSVFGLSYFDWSTLGAGFLVGLLVYGVVQWSLYFIVRTYTHVVYQDVTHLSWKLWKQIASICMAYVWFYTFSLVVLNPTLYATAYTAFLTFATVMGILITMRLIDLMAESLRIRILTKYSNANVDNLIIPLFSRSMKVIVFIFGAASLAQAYHLPVTGILSGMGIGGVAIAFAAKETVGNFFGSVTVLIDRPFEIGDWIVTDGVEGTVEAVGMRSTRIRTFYNSVITIPNNNLTTAVIDNMGRRRYRRLRSFLTLQYENGPERVEAFCEGIKELILSNPFTLKENYYVCLYNLQPGSLEVLLNVFFVCPSTDTENRERAKLLGSILRLARDMGVRFAYPTQRLFLNNEESTDFFPLQGDDPHEIGRSYAKKLLNPNGEEE